MSAPPKPLSQARALSCALMNLCATPGLGSVMGRRVVVGTGQLLLSVTGFGLLLGWMWKFFYQLYQQAMDQPPTPEAYGWLGLWGLIFFGAGWLWSLVTSWSLLQEAKRAAQANASHVPPRLSEIPPMQSSRRG
jgi:hypothetical protein